MCVHVIDPIAFICLTVNPTRRAHEGWCPGTAVVNGRRILVDAEDVNAANFDSFLPKRLRHAEDLVED